MKIVTSALLYFFAFAFAPFLLSHRTSTRSGSDYCTVTPVSFPSPSEFLARVACVHSRAVRGPHGKDAQPLPSAFDQQQAGGGASAQHGRDHYQQPGNLFVSEVRARRTQVGFVFGAVWCGVIFFKKEAVRNETERNGTVQCGAARGTSFETILRNVQEER